MSTSITVQGRAAALANYPHLKRAGNLIFVSGVSSRRPEGGHDGVEIRDDGTVVRDIEAQTRAVVRNIERLLESAGASLTDLVDLTVFLVDMSDYAGMNTAYNAFFDAETGPARTTVAVHELPHPNLLIEIKAVAYVGDRP